MRKDLQALLDETKEKRYSKLTDKQLEQYSLNEQYKKGSKLGGVIVGNRPENIEHMKKLQKTFCILGGKKQGKIQGKKNVESGLIVNLGKKMAIYNNRTRTCPYCGITTRGVGYERWHGEKCKFKK